MSEAETELLEAVRLVTTAFETLGVDYFVGGSVASSIFGEPRQTLDADLVARLLGAHAEPMVERLGDAFYADLPSIQTAIQSQGSFNLIHLESMTKVDVFVHWRHPFAQSQFNRRQKKSIGETRPIELYFASAEDTILAKLDWYRIGGCVSDRQYPGQRLPSVLGLRPGSHQLARASSHSRRIVDRGESYSTAKTARNS
jgi:hypothetical protein